MKNLLLTCAIVHAAIVSSFSQPSHEIFDKLLSKYVSTNGMVNYKGFIQDSASLNKYLKLLSSHPPVEKKWTRNEQIGYWINAYNAFTIKLIIDHYPVKSIKDIGDKVQIPFVNTPWDIKFIRQGTRRVDLNFIEHSILRKMGDPRIHMALVCASKSCPALLNEAYLASNLDSQLNRQTQQFLLDKARNRITQDQMQVSQIFDWYKSDFSQNGGSVREFIKKHCMVKVKDNAPITFLKYDWSLNE